MDSIQKLKHKMDICILSLYRGTLSMEMEYETDIILMTGFTDTNLLSTRSVLFPTRKMSTSPPLCVFTSSIHFDVFKKDCVSAKKDDMIPALHKLKLCLYRRFHLTRFFQRKITFHETNNSKLSSIFLKENLFLSKKERNLKSARLTDLKENFSTHKERILHVPSSVESKTTLECTGGKSFWRWSTYQSHRKR